MILACVRAECLTEVEWTHRLAGGADVNKGDRHGTSPLYAAAQDGEVELVQLLLEFDADPHVGTKEGWLVSHQVSLRDLFVVLAWD